MTLSPEAVRTIARIATGSGLRARFAMRGTSMLPLLREPMILEVAPLTRPAKIGDVLVFVQGKIQVAHRVIRRSGNHYITSGDARPFVLENVPSEDVLGYVEAVWEDGSRHARRVDDRAHRLRGYLYARMNPVRRIASRAKALIRRT
jgi:hypothetical protein